MAENLAEQWGRLCPDRKLLALCGNLHSRIEPKEPHLDCWPSFAACFREIHPQLTLPSMRIAFHGGSFYNNCREVGIPDTPFRPAELKEDAKEGHSYVLNLPQSTPATFLRPPATE